MMSLNDAATRFRLLPAPADTPQHSSRALAGELVLLHSRYPLPLASKQNTVMISLHRLLWLHSLAYEHANHCTEADLGGGVAGCPVQRCG